MFCSRRSLSTSYKSTCLGSVFMMAYDCYLTIHTNCNHKYELVNELQRKAIEHHPQYYIPFLWMGYQPSKCGWVYDIALPTKKRSKLQTIASLIYLPQSLSIGAGKRRKKCEIPTLSKELKCHFPMALTRADGHVAQHDDLALRELCAGRKAIEEVKGSRPVPRFLT